MAYDTPYQPKDNSGSIFKNDRKEKDTHPDGKGSALIDGVEYWVSSWNSVTKDGNQYRKLAFTRKDSAQTAAPRQAAPAPYRKPSQDAAKSRQLAPQAASGFADMDDDIPFNDPMKNRAYTLCV